MLVFFLLKDLLSKCHTLRAYYSKSLEPHFRVFLHEDNTLLNEVNKTLEKARPKCLAFKTYFLGQA